MARALWFVGPANSAVVTDGARFAAVEIDPNSTRVIDTLTGRSYTVATPAGCAQRYGGQGLTSVGGGTLMWVCGATAEGYPAFMNLRTRQLATWPGLYGAARPITALADFAFSAVGRDWVAISIYDHGAEFDVWYVSLAGDRLTRDDMNPRRAINLDAPQLERPLCRGLHRGITTGAGEIPAPPATQLPYTYQPPYALGLFGSDSFTDRLMLQRCGQRPRLLCRMACASIQLGAGIATWVEQAAIVHLMRVGSRQQRTFKFRGAKPAHTANTLFVSVPTVNPNAHGPGAYSWRIYATRL